jgi:hypothetical protein
MTTPEERDALIEATASPFRDRDPHGAVRASRAWHDLDETGRLEAFDRAQLLRRLETSVDPRGLSGTARAVMARIERASR